MLELPDIEICFELPVDAHEQITIECRGHAQLVVVGRNKRLYRLLQVCAEEQRIALPEYASQAPQKLKARVPIEVADGAAQKQHQQMFPLFSPGCYFEQTVQLLAFETDNADAVDVAQLALAHRQSTGRNFDRMIGGRLLPAAESVKDRG